MKLLHYLFEIPMLAIAVWGVYNAQIGESGLVFSLWPLDSEIHVNTKLLLLCFLLYGYVWGKINSWFGAMPMRRELKMQRKTNKALNKEQEKLNETVSGLKQNIAGLQEMQAKAQAEAKQTADQNKPAGKFKTWLNSVKMKFTRKDKK